MTRCRVWIEINSVFVSGHINRLDRGIESDLVLVCVLVFCAGQN